MTPAPQHGTPAGDAALAITKLARATGQDVQDLQTIYSLEGLLARLAVSDQRDDHRYLNGDSEWSDLSL